MTTKIKWLSHAFFEITSSAGKKILIDPYIDNNPLCPVKLDDLGPADVILVTHDHFDHIGNAVDVAQKTGGIVCAAPETIGRLQNELGLPAEKSVNGVGMGIGSTAVLAGIQISMTQAFHSSATATAAGYIIKLEDGMTIYHAGDTGIFRSMKLFGEMYDIDVALLPIGNVFTMDPVQAARAVKLIKPKTVIPMHFRTFPVLEQDAVRFVELAREEAPKTKIVVLEPGQVHTL